MRGPSATALSFGLLGLGWLISAYLLWRVFMLGDGAALGTDVCSTLFGHSCDHTLLSPDSFQLGFPLAGWGLVYFALLGFLLALGLIRTAVLLSAMGLGSSVVLAAILFATKTDICYMCLAIHSINLALLPGLLSLLPKKPALPNAHASSSIRRKPWLKLAVATVAIGALAQFTIWWLDDSVAAFFMDRDVVLAAFRAQPQKEIPVDDLDARIGPADAPVQVVIFSSFQCPGCRRAAHHAKRLVEHFGDRVCIIYKNFPLSSKCNPKSRSDLQPVACDVAWAAQAAQAQNAFWPYHDGLFASQLSFGDEVLRKVGRSISLDMAKWEADRQSPDVQAKVQRDIAVGILLEVDETPSIFVNGRRVRPYTEAVLEYLITQELPVKEAGPQK